MSSLIRTTAVVDLDRAARYGKQLVSHLSRRTGGQWMAEDNNGWIDLQGRRATVSADSAHLTLEVEAASDELDRLEEVLGGHLVRFVDSPEVAVAWTRSDGGQATRQPVS